MSAAPVHRVLSGFGGAPGSASTVVRPNDADELVRAVAEAIGGAQDGSGVPGGSLPRARHALARGLGRAYGDAAQCAGGTVIDCTALDHVEIDEAAGTARAGGGALLAQLLDAALARGMFLPVVPGTAQVSVGGAIAADVHGKNHHRDGAFGSYVERLTLVTADGARELGPASEPELFWATVGGMGLTGVIAEATLRLRRVETSRMRVDTERVPDLDACMARLRAGEQRHRYSVAWVDALARGRHLGRAVIDGGDHATLDDLSPKARRHPLATRRPARLGVPVTSPVRLPSRPLVTAANAAWYGKAPARREGAIRSVASFFHPLDALPGWNRLFGPLGFTQYQLAVPFASSDVVRLALETLQRAGAWSSLAVLKSFGPGDDAPLSFPIAGWTLALDLPLGLPGLPEALDRLDEAVAAAGGRVYLAKDGRLRPELLPVMYPRLGEWLAARERLDASGMFASDLWRRLSPGCCAPHPQAFMEA